jgi:protein-S-isoprenylcysteine O-methyltransferase Ste14
MSALDHLLYALLWASFGAGHSLLAGRRGRRWLAPLAGAYHRLAYNVIATAHLAVIWALGRFVLATEVAPFAWPWPVLVLQAAAVAAALYLFWAGGRRYDAARLLGTRPEAPDAAPEPLVTDGIQGRVRHPLYTAGYLALFAAVQDPFSLATAIWASAYLAVGTWIEERRLLGLYGEAYRDYRRRVPAVIPRLRPADVSRS